MLLSVVVEIAKNDSQCSLKLFGKRYRPHTTFEKGNINTDLKRDYDAFAKSIFLKF